MKKRVLIALVVLLALAATASLVWASGGLVSRWPFDEGTGTMAYDATINDNDGTIVGATWVDGKFGKALSFDGNDYVVVADDSSLEPDTITVEAWVKRSTTPGTYRYIVSKYLPTSGSYSSYGLYTGGSGGLRFYIGYTTSWIASPDAGTTVWDGNWHHVAGTFDGTSVKLYVDRAQVDGATSTIQDIYYSGIGDLFIGCYRSTSYCFSGLIDEVRIWNVALTASQLDDRTAPTITITTPADGATYLLNQAVNAVWSATDGTGTGVASATGTVPSGSPIDTTTAGTHTFTVTAADYAQNTATTTVTYHVPKATPVISWANPADIVYGTALSGTQLNATASVPGSFVYTPAADTVLNAGAGQNLHVDFTPTDTANYNNASADVSINVIYAFGGILQPINADGSSIFKLGSTIPVKFQLRDADGAFVTDAVAHIWLTKVSDNGIGTVVEAVSTSAATTGNLFRYDNTSNQYIFNLATKPLSTGMSTGTWEIRIDLDDGTSQYVDISLR